MYVFFFFFFFFFLASCSMALFGMNYGTYKRKRELFFDSWRETAKEKLIVNQK